MADVEEYADDLKELTGLFDAAAKKARDLAGFKVEQIVESYQFMFDRFCPLKVGQRVMLTTAPDFERAPGWRHCKHFLVPGAEGVVKNRGYSNNHFVFDIEFDDQSYIDRNDEEIPLGEKCTFRFREADLAFLDTAARRPDTDG